MLIVIVVIGILSAMMMLSSSEAVSSAKATAIISDLRNLKTAALAYFADNFDEYMTKGGARYEISSGKDSSNKDKNEWDIIMTYLNGKDFPNKNCYKIITSNVVNNDVAFYVECSISGKSGGSATPLYDNANNSECKAVKKKLAGRAKSVGLLADRYAPSQNKSAYTNGDYIFMLVQ
ncbi:MAG: type II secretion system protein [Synergistaceae bacterium]|nr:type II secretion system protein [Synergistaceae bacterium]